MKLRPRLITPPSGDVVTRDEVKANCRIDSANTDDDAVIDTLIAAAVAHLDGWSGILGRCLLNQTWAVSLSCWPACRVDLQFPDVSAAVVKYIDPAGAEQLLNAANFRRLEGAGGTMLEWVRAFAAPSLNVRSDAITIEMTAGYGADASAIPADIKRAIILLCSHWYEHREATSPDAPAELPFAVTALLYKYRRIAL